MGIRIRLAVAACGLALGGAASAATEPVLDWNAVMVRTTAAEHPVYQARIAAITQLAVFEAVNAIQRDYEPYRRLQAPRTASAPAAAAAAAHAVLRNYFPASGAALDAAYAESLAGIADGAPKQEGIEVGVAAAAALIALRADDGAAPDEFHRPASTRPGEWQPTPSCPPAGGILRQWARLQPFAIGRADRFRAPPPPALSSLRYARDYEEVKRVGAADSPYRPRDRADVARFYAVTSPVAVWNSVTTQIAVERRRSPSDTARVLALVAIAISDAQAAVFDTKYTYDFWRPETAIRAGDADGNPRTRGDAAYTPYIVAPCFPSYASAHGSTAGAAREVLEREFGAHHHLVTLANPAVPGVRLEYSALPAITGDIDDARVYGGIHFRFDQDAGARIGRQVGAYVQRRALRRAHRPGASRAAFR